ncbi:MAG: translation initiation factor IF-2 [Deltaproteobacteria bacterium]|nr:translation initiation factor IF-2 [Deltaproteobacteria bacterium]
MAKIRLINLAKELDVDVRRLIQRLKDEMGIQLDKGYLSSLDEEVAARVRQAMKQAPPQMEEMRVGETIRRRRRMAPAAVEPVAETPAPVEAPPSPPPKAAAPPKRREPVARIVSLPPKEKPAPEAAPPPPPAAEAASREAAAPMEVTAPVASPEAAAPKAAKPPMIPVIPPAPQVPPAPGVKRRSKAKKKDVPARIISLPTEPVKPPVAAAPPTSPPPRAEGTKPKAEAGRPKPGLRPSVEMVRPLAEGKPQPPQPVEERKEVKGKKKPKKVEVVEAARAKSVKKREVRERADLYGVSEAEGRGLARKKGLKKAFKKVTRAELTVPKAIKRRIKVGESITVGELAKRMGIKSGEIIKQLIQMGVMATINYPMDYEAASIVAGDFGFEVERATVLEEDLLAATPRVEGEAKPRPPVVTIMGHVDHGKTSLLDVIRESRLTEVEAGGITQHIGAYHVKLPGDQGEIVFLDTPGHEAFTAMRARGAQVTDLVVLVVAADDGVMEQTLEAISHAKAAEVPIVVAVNKIDKPNANPERVKRELANHGVVPEEWGGDVLMAEVSAKKRIGIDDLLEKILLQAEVLALHAPREALARGRIIESRLDKGRGPVGTVLVQEGTLKPGDYFVCGSQFGRVRAMFDDRGHRIEEALPGVPTEVQGFSGVPEAGEEFLVLEDERKVRQIAMMRQQKQREATLARISRVSLERLYQHIQEGSVKELKMVLKADVHGSIEALAKALSEMGTKEIKVSIIHTGIGEIRESDIMLASASDAIVVGFNVRANPKAQSLAEQEQVDMRFYDIIYNLLQEVHAALEGLLEPLLEEKLLGRAEVRAVFSVSKVGTVAGCMVLDGKVERNSLARVVRRGQTVAEGAKINSLKRFKEDVKEVQAGYECGIGLDRFNDFQTGDFIESYMQEKVKAQLAAPAGRPEKSG